MKITTRRQKQAHVKGLAFQDTLSPTSDRTCFYLQHHVPTAASEKILRVKVSQPGAFQSQPPWLSWKVFLSRDCFDVKKITIKTKVSSRSRAIREEKVQPRRYPVTFQNKPRFRMTPTGWFPTFACNLVLESLRRFGKRGDIVNTILCHTTMHSRNAVGLGDSILTCSMPEFPFLRRAPIFRAERRREKVEKRQRLYKSGERAWKCYQL